MVDDWRRALHWSSMWFNAAGLFILGIFSFDPAAVLSVWNMMPGEARSALPHNFVTILGGALTALAMLSRMVKQKPRV